MQPVCGLGDPVLDIVVRVPHEFLQREEFEPGGCISVEQGEMDRLLGLPEVQSDALRWAACSA